MEAVYNSKYNNKIETLRGIAILLVISGHVIGSDSFGGMQVAENSFFRHFYFTFEYIRLPLFTAISGFVYSIKPVSNGYFISFINKKIKRILFPMVFVGASYFLLQYFVPHTNSKGVLSEIWKILFFPYTLYWYLPSLFFVFIITAFLDLFKKLDNTFQLIVVFSFSLFTLMISNEFVSINSPNYFGYKGAIYLFPFFIIGVGIQRFNKLNIKPIFIFILLIILSFSIVLQQLYWYKLIDYNFNKNNGVGLIISIISCIFLLKINFQIKWLMWIGGFAYSLFLFHAFGTAAGRILINNMGFSNNYIVFIFSMFCGLCLPLIAESILKLNRFSRLLFLGKE